MRTASVITICCVGLAICYYSTAKLSECLGYTIAKLLVK